MHDIFPGVLNKLSNLCIFYKRVSCTPRQLRYDSFIIYEILIFHLKAKVKSKYKVGKTLRSSGNIISKLGVNTILNFRMLFLIHARTY